MMAGSGTNLTPHREAEFLLLQNEGKKLAKEGKISESLEKMKKALHMCHTEKLAKRVEKLEKFLQECEGEEADPMIEVGKGFYLFHELYEKLYPYQKEGILWLWKLYRKQKGGVLGDDMGLGKTVQIIAFLSGMFDSELIKSVLIVMPVSLLPVWEKEFDKWAPGICLHGFYSSSRREGEKNLKRVQLKGGVIITSYGMLVNSYEKMAELEGRKFIWDYLILDEGHKIKNPTKTTKAVHAIPSRNRVVLTGTPIQNNLKELWSLYDFVHQGTLLGSLQTFRVHYETPITRSREKDATIGERRLGSEIAENLKHLIAPYFLRRTKAEVLQMDNQENINPNRPQADINEKWFSLSRKNDLIVWIYLSPAQIQIYKDFLELDMVKNILLSKRSPLVELTILKKTCDHPRLLSRRACIQLGLDGAVSEEELETTLQDESALTMDINNVSDETLIEESGKLALLMKLLENLRSEKHRTLIFSQSRKILDIIQRILKNRNWKVMRIDGTLTKVEDREKNIQHFQNDPSYSVFLLTTQVGGVGLTLTEADRVVIYDPSWNPATDAQAVDRVYRIGQSKSVVIYRLITCGTVEEKIYRRQIFKDSITRQATGGSKDPHRYFSRQELRELFTMDNPHYSSTQVQLEQMHADQRKTDQSLDEHIAFLYSLDIFGISDHDLMFSKDFPDNPSDEDNRYSSSDYIKQKVEMAQHVVQVEANQTHEDNLKSGTYARPFAVPITTVKRNYAPDTYNPPFTDEMIKNSCTVEGNNLQMSSEENDFIDCNDISNLSPAFKKDIEHNDVPDCAMLGSNIERNDLDSKNKMGHVKDMHQSFETEKSEPAIEPCDLKKNSFLLETCSQYQQHDKISTFVNDDDIQTLNKSFASVVIVSDSDDSMDEQLGAENRPVFSNRKSILVPDSDSSKDMLPSSANASLDMFVAESDDDDELATGSNAFFSRDTLPEIVNTVDVNLKCSNTNIRESFSLNRRRSSINPVSAKNIIPEISCELNEEISSKNFLCAISKSSCAAVLQKRNSLAEENTLKMKSCHLNSPDRHSVKKMVNCSLNKENEGKSSLEESHSENNGKTDNIIKKRIVPLRVPAVLKGSDIPSSPFQKALTASVELSPKMDVDNSSKPHSIVHNTILHNSVMMDEDVDSPLQISKRCMKRLAITSGSEEEDEMSNTRNETSGEEGEIFDEESEVSYEESEISYEESEISDDNEHEISHDKKRLQ